MLPIRLKLEPSQDASHTRLRMTVELAEPLHGWQLKDFAAMLQAFTRRRTRVVMSAAAPAEWLDEWSLELEEAELEVEFRLPRRRLLRG